MGKIREIFHGPHKNFAKFVVGSTSLFLVLWILGPGNNFIHWIKAGIEIQRQERLIEITADGNIDDDEIKDFVFIQQELERISITVETLQLWVERMLADGKINIEKYNKMKEKSE